MALTSLPLWLSCALVAMVWWWPSERSAARALAALAALGAGGAGGRALTLVWLAGDPAYDGTRDVGSAASAAPGSPPGSATLGALALPTAALLADSPALAPALAAAAWAPRRGGAGSIVINGRAISGGVGRAVATLALLAVAWDSGSMRSAIVATASGYAGAVAASRVALAFPSSLAAGEVALLGATMAAIATDAMDRDSWRDPDARALRAAATGSAAALTLAARGRPLYALALAAVALYTAPYAHLRAVVEPFATHLAAIAVAGVAAATALTAAAARGWAPRIAVRKGYHVLAFFALAPLLRSLAGRRLVSLASAGVVALLCVCEGVRLRGWPAPLARLFEALTAPLRDERDAGALVTSHLTLALGIGCTLWLVGPDWPQEASIAALAALGVGDTAAAALGSRLGGRASPRLPNGKSLEGATACFVATYLAQVSAAHGWLDVPRARLLPHHAARRVPTARC